MTSMPNPPGPTPRGTGPAPEMEAAAWAVLGAGLRSESSALDPTVTTWRLEVAQDLQRQVEFTPGEGSGGFLDKLRGQLQQASDPVILLATELMYLHNVPLTNVTASTKTKRITTMLSWLTPERELPPPLAQGLQARGAFNGAQGFNRNQWRHLHWLCRFVITWCSTSPQLRMQALEDPWVFRQISASVPDEVASIRYTLEYLAWPGVFPPIVSPGQRTAILDGMAADIGGRTGKDDLAITRDLVGLRRHHSIKPGSGQPGWYEPPYASRWQKQQARSPRAWLVRPSDEGAALVHQWQQEGFVSLKADMLGVVDPGASLEQVRHAIDLGYAHLDLSQRAVLAQAYHHFLTDMQPEDVVATIHQDHLVVGEITGKPEYAPEQHSSRLRREVNWSLTGRATTDLPAPIPSLLEEQGSVVDLTSAYDLLTPLLEAEVDAAAQQPEPVVTAAPEVVPDFPAVSQELAQALHMDLPPLQELADLLHSRQQVVLYGPPGTGKTFVAKALAKHLTGDPSRVRLVQFHPSYSYEDFFEGYRPTLTETGQPGFALQSGPLRLIAEEATNPDNRQHVYVLIIDEMNRANLAKVFGELYFLLEYRRDTVRLQYHPDKAFRLPLNLFLIGTMNTADRSIALVDAAIRRRFPFYEMHPSQPPVAGVLPRYVAATCPPEQASADQRVRLLAALNLAMGAAGHDLHIGPSYLMRPAAATPEGLKLVWRHDIMPLLEEHFYGHKSRAEMEATFGLDALRRRVGANTTSPSAPEASE